MHSLLLGAALALCATTSTAQTAVKPAPRVDVILWFDTEDYLLPADDDATKRLCEMLTKRGIRATFKMVGEKARVLEKRGRTDVIAALKKHDIGYHSDFHSVHPTPTEYLADCGWLDGIQEFARREGDGAADVRRIFGVKTLACYGQPGSSWGPQTLAALKQIGVAPHGIPCYVDEGNHVGLDNKPFWYAGALNVYHMGQNYTRMELHDAAALEPAMKKVSDIAARLRGEGGGLISIFYHPCEWVHKEFWDGVNFSRGANPAREKWKAPGQRTAEETEAAFERFGKYIDHINSISGVKWITASDLPLRYQDLSNLWGVTSTTVTQLARNIANNPAQVDMGRSEIATYSVADTLELLIDALSHRLDHPDEPTPFLRTTGLMGPDSLMESSGGPDRLDWLAFRDALRDVGQFVQMHKRVPSRVFVGTDWVAPADFLTALANAWVFYQEHKRLPVQEGVRINRDVRVVPEKYIAADTPKLFGDWIIHKEGFRAPKLMELARLQAWTLKPAMPTRP